MKYLDVNPNYKFSDYNSVFSSTSNCVGDYSFHINVLDKSKIIKDHSGNGNNGQLSELQFGVLNGYGGVYGYSNIFFSNWDNKKQPSYFFIPLQTESLSNFTKTGSVEMWIDYKSGFLNEKEYDTDDYKHIQIFATEDGSLELYYYQDSFYFVPNVNNSKAFVRIPWIAKNSDKFGVEFPISISWDFNKKEAICYLYGKKQTIDLSFLKKNWKKVSDSKALFVAGNPPPANNYFAAQIDGLYLYDSMLSEQDIFYLYQSHNPKNIYLHSEMDSHSHKNVTTTPLFSSLKTTDSINYITHYAAPYTDLEPWVSHQGQDHVFLFSNKSDGSNEVFGIPGHFYSYTGTPVHAKKPCYIEFVGLEINDPALVKDLTIDFSYTRFWKKYHDISQKKDKKSSFANFFQKTFQEFSQLIIPSVYSCGPSWHYRSYGSSILISDIDSEELTSLGPNNTKTIWYRLKNPIFVNEELDLMQIRYKTNNRSGFLKIKFSEMVCREIDGTLSKCSYDKNYNYDTYGYLDQEWNENTKTYDYYKHDELVSLAPYYQAFLANEEKGMIELEVSVGKNIVDLVFKNLGNDTIQFNEDTVNFILNGTFLKPWTKFLFVSTNGSTYSVNARDVLDKMKGKEIERYRYISVPLIYWSNLMEQPGFSDTESFLVKIQTSEEDEKQGNYNFSNDPLPKVIFWGFQNNSYRAKDINYKFTVSSNRQTIKLADD